VDFTVVETNRKQRTPLADIDPDVIAAIEELWADAPAVRVETPVLGTQTDAEAWLSDARSYGYHRGTLDGKERLVVTGNTTKKGAVRLAVTAYDTGE
jgi:hypothetical protein